ncbi:MAG: His-Xaa-Ser system protein HxsD, partial [Candidatus Portnoybacteria bacterium]
MNKTKNNTIRFSFSLKDYPMEAVYGAAYVFVDKAYLFLESKSKDKVEVYLKAKKKSDNEKLEELKGEFLNELLNYTVRIKLAKSNKKIRDYVVSQALLSAIGEEAISQEEEKDEMKYEDDPLGIAVPW